MRCFSGAAGLACLGPPAVFKRPTVSCYCRCLPTACLITSVGPGELGRAVCVGGGRGACPSHLCDPPDPASCPGATARCLML